MADADIGILAVMSDDLQNLPTNYKNKIMESIQPVVVPVGGDSNDLREKVKRVIGVDLYKNEDD